MIRRTMLLITGICAAVALVAATAGASSPVSVGLSGCYFANGGNATVPAGSAVTVRFAWGENNRGRVQDFLNAQTTTADVNGTPIAGASGLWGPIQDSASTWRASAGTLANAGDSVTVHFQVNVTHVVSEGKDPDTGQHFKVGPGALLPADFGCTITAV
jgi:hypothetical protein